MAVNKILMEVELIDDILNWYIRRGGLLPYDWNDNFTPHWNKLKKSIKYMRTTPRFQAWYRKKKKMYPVHEITFHDDGIIILVLTGEKQGFTHITMPLRVPQDADLIQMSENDDNRTKEVKG